MKTKSRFLLAASLAFAITFTLVSCGENGNPFKGIFDDVKGNLTALTSSNLLQNGNMGMGFMSGSLPGSALDQGSVDVIESVTVNGQAVEGGSTSITVVAKEELEELYISIEGEDGYYVQALDEYDLVDGKYSYFFVLQFNQTLAESDAAEEGEEGKEMVFKVSGKTKSGNTVQESEEKKIIIQEAESGGTEGLQISVSWDQLDDVDLHVITPSGARVYFGNLEEGNVKLDFDSNAGCRGDGINSENIYVEAPIEDGEYTVELRLYSKCTSSGTAGSRYHVTANSNGNFIDFAGKKQTGKFNDSDNTDVREIGTITVVNGRVSN